MTPTPCTLTGCIISVMRTYSCTYLHSWLGRIKPAISPKSEIVEDTAKATINGLYKVVYWLSIAAKMYDLE